MSLTVNGRSGADSVDPPISAWFPMTRGSVMCVMAARYLPAVAGGWPNADSVARLSRRLFIGSRADFWCSS